MKLSDLIDVLLAAEEHPLVHDDTEVEVWTGPIQGDVSFREHQGEFKVVII